MNRKNSEGYSDPTAAKAIESVTKEDRQVYKLVHLIKDMCALFGFEIIGRIELEHKDSGRRFK